MKPTPRRRLPRRSPGPPRSRSQARPLEWGKSRESMSNSANRSKDDVMQYLTRTG